uniref:Interleukin-1 beta n=2 Tax=Cyprinus carpio TaxID=7962 RepID=A0A8C1H6S5_CYPCA
MSTFIFIKGDKLQMISIHLILSFTSLTEKTEECQSEAPQCNKKMFQFMRFSLSMEDTELGALQEPSHLQPEQKEKDIEDDCIIDDDVFHSVANMSLTLMADQDSDADNPICNSDWLLNEKNEVLVVIFCCLISVSAQIWNVIKEQSNLKTVEGNNYVASKQNKICLEKTMSAKITIFQCIFLGTVPSNKSSVVLNFTGTDKFLCCTSRGEEKILTIKVYDRKNIDISADDPEKLSLIFYMSLKYDGLRDFESALHRGWFIHTVNDDVVKMKRGNETSSSRFILE